MQGISAPLDNDFWHRYQKKNFEEAMRIALEASLNDVPLVSRSMFIAHSLYFLLMIRVKPVDKNLVTLINFNFRDVRVTLKTV